jgi:SSS family solute:Na+ symporter
VIAVPALVYAVGAYGFFALPYTIIVYPFVFAVMPLLWKVAHANGHVTAPTWCFGTYGSRRWNLRSRSPAWSRPCPISRCN